MHGARNEAVHAFRDVVSTWSQQTENLSCFYFYEQLNEDAEQGPTIIPGWVAVPRIADSIIQPDAIYYLCGPEPFLRKQFVDLIALGVQPEAIRYEEFGPQTLVLGAKEKLESEVA
ncbi:hypothetical protein GCM10028817_00850 [Spirosoma pomorum]